MKIIFLGLLCLLVGTQLSLAVDSEWHWNNAAAGEQGVAKNVVVTGGKFTADLYEDDLAIHPKAPPAIRLSGTISHGHIVGSAIYVGTDAGREPYNGELHTGADQDRVTLKGGWAGWSIELTQNKNPPPASEKQ